MSVVRWRRSECLNRKALNQFLLTVLDRPDGVGYIREIGRISALTLRKDTVSYEAFVRCQRALTREWKTCRRLKRAAGPRDNNDTPSGRMCHSGYEWCR